MYQYKTEEEVVEAGRRFLRAGDWDTVRRIASDALEQHPGDDEAQDEDIFQSVDGNHYVIYTKANLDVLKFTEHDDAYEDIYGSDLSSLAQEGAYHIYQVLAFCAM